VTFRVIQGRLLLSRLKVCIRFLINN